MIELNQEALKSAEQMRYQGPALTGDIVRAYLEALPKPAPKMRQIPFDPAKVKPGDEVLCTDMLLRYLCQAPNGDVITERDGPGLLLQRWPPAYVTIPTPAETVKVALYRNSGDIQPFRADDASISEWGLCSDIIDIEVTR